MTVNAAALTALGEQLTQSAARAAAASTTAGTNPFPDLLGAALRPDTDVRPDARSDASRGGPQTERRDAPSQADRRDRSARTDDDRVTESEDRVDLDDRPQREASDVRRPERNTETSGETPPAQSDSARKPAHSEDNGSAAAVDTGNEPNSSDVQADHGDTIAVQPHTAASEPALDSATTTGPVAPTATPELDESAPRTPQAQTGMAASQETVTGKTTATLDAPQAVRSAAPTQTDPRASLDTTTADTSAPDAEESPIDVSADSDTGGDTPDEGAGERPTFSAAMKRAIGRAGTPFGQQTPGTGIEPAAAPKPNMAATPSIVTPQQTIPTSQPTAPALDPAVSQLGRSAGSIDGALSSSLVSGSARDGSAPLAAGKPSTRTLPPTPLRAEPIGLRIAQAARGGETRFDIALDPPELGRIDVKLDIAQDGQMRAVLTADRTETLDLLQRDARALERTLQSAGLNLRDGGLEFSLRDQNGGQGGADRGTADTGSNPSNGDAAADGSAELADTEWRPLSAPGGVNIVI